jgi:hypothetical protein
LTEEILEKLDWDARLPYAALVHGHRCLCKSDMPHEPMTGISQTRILEAVRWAPRSYPTAMGGQDDSD